MSSHRHLRSVDWNGRNRLRPFLEMAGAILLNAELTIGPEIDWSGHREYFGAAVTGDVEPSHQEDGGDGAEVVVREYGFSMISFATSLLSMQKRTDGGGSCSHRGRLRPRNSSAER